jgi:hypothetical protein
VAKTEALELEEIPHCGELVSALLPSSPPFSGNDFAMVMAEFYHRCASSQAWESARDDEQTWAEEHDFSRSVWTITFPGSRAVTIFDALLQAEDINGKKITYSPYEAFEHFVQFSSEDGTVSYGFLFYLFKFLNLVCSSGAFIPYVSAGERTLEIVWRPFETLPQISAMLEAIASRECGMLTIIGKTKDNKSKKQTVSGRSVVDILASAFLNEWVRRKFLSFRGSFNKHGTGDEYSELLNLFFQRIGIDVSTPARQSLPQAIDQWLSVLHIDFSAYRYSLTVKTVNAKRALVEDDAHNYDLQFALSMDVLSESEDGVKKIPLSKVKDLEILRAPIALSNYLP